MFESRNRNFINDIVKQSLSRDKLRNILIAITIIFATTLASLNLLLWNSIGIENIRNLDKSQDVFYHNVSINQVRKLEANTNFLETICMKQGKASEYDGYSITPFYVENKDEYMKPFLQYDGTFPLEENEILIDKNLSTYYGEDLEIGDSITIDFFDGYTETFIITGMFNSEIDSNDQVIHTSEKYAENGSQLKDLPFQLAAKLHDSKSMTKESFQTIIDEIGFEVGLEKFQINPNNSLFVILSINQEQLIMYLCISGFILIVSAIVIYSIFYISINSRTREFGQLRTIGATTKQIQKIITKEGLTLCNYAIPIGLIIGVLLCFIAKPNGFELFSSIKLCLFVAIAMVLTVLISIRKPAKLAGSVSPIEALKPLKQKTVKQTSKVLERNLSPVHLAIMNRKINRRKFIMTTLSLSLTGISFIIGATFLSSFNLEKGARQGASLAFHDISLGFSQNAIDLHENGLIGLQLEAPFHEAFINKLSNIEGIDKVTTAGNIPINYNFKDGGSDSSLISITEDDLAIYKNFNPYLTVSYEEMVDSKGIIVNRNNLIEEYYGYSFSIGDEIVVSWFNGSIYQEDSFTVVGTLDSDNTIPMIYDKNANHTQLSYGDFIVPQETFDSMMIPNFDFTTKIVLSTTDWDKYGQSALTEIEEILIDYPNIVITNKLDDALKRSQSLYDTSKIFLYIVLSFLGIFSLINLFNTLITNVISRKQEFAILQSIGLTNRQLKTMIQSEGLLFALYNSVTTLIFGGIGGYLMVLAFEAQSIKYLDWSFPILYYIIYAVIIFLVPVMISFMAIKILQKKSIIERLHQK